MKTLKALTICLLICVLPLQGLAAVSLAFCHAEKIKVMQHVEHGTHAHSHDAHHAHKEPSKLNHKCGHCAQCCAGYVMVSFDSPNAPLMGMETVWVEIKPVLHASVLPRTLERPPRFLMV